MMVDYWKQAVDQTFAHFSRRFPTDHADMLYKFAESVTEFCFVDWNRRPWTRPPWQTGRRQSIRPAKKRKPKPPMQWYMWSTEDNNFLALGNVHLMEVSYGAN